MKLPFKLQKSDESRSKADIAQAFILFVLTIVLFTPATIWLLAKTQAHQQLSNAGAVLLLAGVALITEKQHVLKVHLVMTNKCRLYLGASFVLLAVGSLFGRPILIFPAYACALAGWLLYAFGDRIHRAAICLLAVTLLYCLLALNLEKLDWSLRTVAGRQSALVLEMIGCNVDLDVAGGTAPRLMLRVNNRTFHVASECNGYGIIGSTALMALLLVMYRRFKLSEKILYWMSAVCLAIVSNTVRIVIICLLAPHVPSYHIMHETVGYTTFTLCLWIIWIRLNQIGKHEKTEPERKNSSQ